MRCNSSWSRQMSLITWISRDTSQKIKCHQRDRSPGHFWSSNIQIMQFRILFNEWFFKKQLVNGIIIHVPFVPKCTSLVIQFSFSADINYFCCMFSNKVKKTCVCCQEQKFEGLQPLPHSSFKMLINPVIRFHPYMSLHSLWFAIMVLFSLNSDLLLIFLPRDGFTNRVVIETFWNFMELIGRDPVTIIKYIWTESSINSWTELKGQANQS